jgi:hypothetical protein
MSPLHGVDAHFDFVSPPATTGLAWITSPSFSIGLCAFAVTSDGKDVRSFASLPAIMQSLNDWTDVQCPLWVKSRHAAKSDVRFTPNSDRESGLAAKLMSALAPKADMCGATAHVRYGDIVPGVSQYEVEPPLIARRSRGNAAQSGKRCSKLSRSLYQMRC